MNNIMLQSQGTKCKAKSDLPIVLVNNRRHIIDKEKRQIQDERMPWLIIKYDELNIDQCSAISEQLDNIEWFN
jgi:hypothetical protein